ncbi:MAG: ABC transporter ATP-binding protein [Chloroflexi bacterium]|nr:ABC transporter ATP-binding protein [Chloroflexota bacterium]
MNQIDVELRQIVKEFPARGSEGSLRAVDDVSLHIEHGEFFALLGPSGCGKTTTLRMIAGFEELSSGDILIRGQSMRGVPAFHRPVNTVFQDYALFPHMTALQNVMFGLEMENISKAEARQRAEETLTMVRLNQYDRKPRQLSGGQQQRVALARALVKRPAVLLLDEPLGALDLKLRQAMQYELMQMQQRLGITFVYVTHDQEEALTMADRIAVMDSGRVLQVGRPDEIYEQPNSRFVADFIGETNFMQGTLRGREGAAGTVQIDAETRIEAQVNGSDAQPDHEVTVAIRPEKITLVPVDGVARQGDSYQVPAEVVLEAMQAERSKTMLPGTITFANYIGTDTRYIVRIGANTDLVVRVQNAGQRYDTIFQRGQSVMVFWATENARILTH